MRKIAFASLAVMVVSACGGGGGSAGTCSGSAQYCAENAAHTTTTSVETTTALFSSSSVAQQCATPRPATAVNPLTKQLYGDVQGSLTTEKSWIRAYVTETYLWYNEVLDSDPALFAIGLTVPYIEPTTNSRGTLMLKSDADVRSAYFNSQRTTALTDSGRPKDRFHFTVPTAEWTAQSLAGSSVGFGFQVSLVAASPPRKAVIAFSEPGSAAALNGLNRGTQFLKVNGVDVSTGNADVLNEGLFSPLPGKPYTFEVLDQGGSASRTVVLTPATITSVPVQNVRTLAAPYGGVGYILFNEHIATAESQLITAVNQLKGANGGAGISDLILDLRYNSGGYLDLASELAYMIAGPTMTAGKAFEKLSFNDKNPFKLSDADKITPFHDRTQGLSTSTGQALPHLDLPRVYVITGADTCSASESVMNGLRGAGVEVVQIGGTTCGKPYGFAPQDNCSTTYFTVQFKGVNQLGYGDYADGFIPGGTGSQGNNLPGCAVADDFSKPLGDTTEARIAAALQYRGSGSCGGAVRDFPRTQATSVAEPILGGRSVVRENRFYRPRAQL